MNPPVIAQLLPALNHGGVERGTIEVANYLAENGWKSIVVSSGGQLIEQLHTNVEHIQLDLGKKSLITLFKVKKLRHLILSKRVNVVHARSRLPAWIAYKAIAGIKNNPPKFVTTVHGLYSVKRYSSIMARGERVIAVSETAKKYVEDNYSDCLRTKVDLIYRGINPKDFPYKKLDESFAQSFYSRFPQLKNQSCVLLPGRLSSLKGLEELGEWLRITDAKLLITSTPEQSKSALKWLTSTGLNSKVEWIGYQSEIAKIYPLMNLIISPSTRPESFGRTVAEALATGTPVVGYAHGGVKEILSQILPQGLVPLNARKQFAETVEDFLQSPPLVPNQQPFLLDEMLKHTMAVYRECANSE